MDIGETEKSKISRKSLVSIFKGGEIVAEILAVKNKHNMEDGSTSAAAVHSFLVTF